MHSQKTTIGKCTSECTDKIVQVHSIVSGLDGELFVNKICRVFANSMALKEVLHILSCPFVKPSLLAKILMQPAAVKLSVITVAYTLFVNNSRPTGILGKNIPLHI